MQNKLTEHESTEMFEKHQEVPEDAVVYKLVQVTDKCVGSKYKEKN
jgi:hypothetical protein